MSHRLFALTAALALPLSAPATSQVPARVDLDSVQPLAGAWSYRPIPNGSEARFADAAAALRLSVRCNRASRTVSVVRTGVPAAAPALAVWTTSLSRSVPSRFIATGELIADLNANDPLLDAIAFSRGRFATGAQGAPLAAVAAAPEVARTIEDCRG